MYIDIVRSYGTLNSMIPCIHVLLQPIFAVIYLPRGYRIRIIVFNATFNNISVISWKSVLLVEEIGVPGENHRPAASHQQTLSPSVVSSTPRSDHDLTS